MVPAASDLHFAFGRQQLADGVRPVPWVTSGGQKDRFCEPQSRRLDHRRNHLVCVPGRAGLQDSGPGWERVGPVNVRGLNPTLEGLISRNSCRSAPRPPFQSDFPVIAVLVPRADPGRSIRPSAPRNRPASDRRYGGSSPRAAAGPLSGRRLPASGTGLEGNDCRRGAARGSPRPQAYSAATTEEDSAREHSGRVTASPREMDANARRRFAGN